MDWCGKRTFCHRASHIMFYKFFWKNNKKETWGFIKYLKLVLINDFLTVQAVTLLKTQVVMSFEKKNTLN